MSFCSLSTSSVSDSPSTGPSSSDHFSSDRLSLRRRPFGDQRVHRCRRVYAGPDLCQQRVDPFHSSPNIQNFIGTDGSPKNGKKNPIRIVPALADCPLKLPNYGVPYSMNRHKLWELPDLAAGNLSLCQNPLTDHRVSTILQRANPLRKGLLDGQSRNTKFRAIGNLLEEGVAELHTFDGGEEVRREAKSARGANQLAQLMQKGSKPKKRRNSREGRAETEGEQRWLDLFEAREYSEPTQSLGPARTSADSDPFAPSPLHTYCVFRVQQASRHQLNSGWQDGHAERRMTKAEVRDGGRWREAEGPGAGEQWQAMGRRQIGGLHWKNSPLVQKRRGGPFSKGGERFAIAAETEEYGEEEDSEQEMDMEEQQEEEERVARDNGDKLDIDEFVVAKGRRLKAKAKKKRAVAIEVDAETEKNGSIPAETLSFSGIGDKEQEDEDEDELWELAPEFGKAMEHLREAGELEREQDQFGFELPQNAEIHKCRVGSESLVVELGCRQQEPVIVPPGSRIVVRRTHSDIGGTNDRYLLNPASGTIPDFSEQQPSTSSAPSVQLFDIDKTTNDFLRDLSSLLPNKTRWFVASEMLRDDAEADGRAVELLLSGAVPSGTSPAHPESASSPPPSLFCGVCFAECTEAEGLALSGCVPRWAHFFCDRCWRRHIRHSLAHSLVPITCMAVQCPSVLSPFCALLVARQSVADSYTHLMARKRRMRCDFIVCGECNGILRILPESPQWRQPVTHCAHCDEFICTRCTKRQHLPLNCEERELYEQILQSNGQSLRSLMLSRAEGRIVSGVLCSNCHNLVDKHQGCDHISCPCGHEFCWRCGNSWQHYEHPCHDKGRVNLPLFDIVLIRGPGGKHLAKSAHKFFAECADLRALRQSHGRQLQKQMDRIFHGEHKKARRWMAKFVQMSEFVEFCLVKRLLAVHKKRDQFGTDADRLRFIFGTIPFIAGLRDEKLVVNPGMVEQYYGEAMAGCRRIMAQIGAR